MQIRSKEHNRKIGLGNLKHGLMAGTRKQPAELQLWYHAKRRAKDEGCEFDLELSDIVIPAYCPALGIPLVRGRGRICDGSPTLDRIVSSKGYVRGNVKVISYKANRSKSNLTPIELRLLAEYAERETK
jgi:hypothetical protein